MVIKLALVTKYIINAYQIRQGDVALLAIHFIVGGVINNNKHSASVIKVNGRICNEAFNFIIFIKKLTMIKHYVN